jgi:hypothetical protein
MEGRGGERRGEGREGREGKGREGEGGGEGEGEGRRSEQDTAKKKYKRLGTRVNFCGHNTGSIQNVIFSANCVSLNVHTKRKIHVLNSNFVSGKIELLTN